MKKLQKVLTLAACLAALSLSVGNLAAQNGGGGGGGGNGGGNGGGGGGRRNGGGGGGNFDPAQFRQNRIDRMRDPMDVKDDAEWKVIGDAIGKVMDAQQAVQAGQARGMFGRNRGGGGGGGGGGQAGGGGGQGGGGGRGGFGQQPSPEAEALQAAIEAKAPADEIKTKLAALRAANKANQDKLDNSQADLRKLLTARQEAVGVLSGVLK